MFLNCHSQFSLRYGTLKVEELLELAMEYKQEAIVLTDINNTSACLNFVRLAEIKGVKPLLGIDFREGNRQEFVAIAKNNRGFEEINGYLSYFLHQKEAIPSRAKKLKEAYVIYPFRKYRYEFIRLRKNEFIGISLQELKQLPFSPWRSHQDKFVLLQTVSFHRKRDYNIHRLLRAIDHNSLLTKMSAEAFGEPQHRMLPQSLIEESLEDFPEILENSRMILEECRLSFVYKGLQKSGAVNHNKQHFLSSKEEDIRLLRELCEKGIEYRYPNVKCQLSEVKGQNDKRTNKQISKGAKHYSEHLEEKQFPSSVFRPSSSTVRSRLEKELQLIEQQGFASYFLINWDMLRFAREKGFFYVGRGSGANSIVAYLLRITDVDPIKLDLYFERFINPYRENPPDFDIDFSWKDRDEVTNYLFRKYGSSNQIALLATYNTFSYRSLVRELGKVFGLPKHEMDKLVSERKVMDEPDDYTRLIYKYAAYMDGMPNYLSVHAGGIIISERSVHYYSATEIPPKGYPIVQFDMVHAEDAGLYKFDVLSQRGLGKIRDSVDLVKQRGKDLDLDIHHTAPFFEDPIIKDLLRNGDAMGCFYVESPAMRMLLSKMKTDTYLGLVAASSIIRPGVAKSGMMRAYLSRSLDQNEEWRKTTPKIMQEILGETYGVMVYQEDVIKVAHYFAGLSLGEADMLRRGMSGKFRSREEFAKVKQKFFDNCKEKEYPDELTAEIWRQTESFAGYAFSKGHSASYAVESYQHLYLKAHHPLEFILGVLNNGGGFYSTEMYLHEARMLGAKIEAPCVNHSKMLSVLEGENTIYMGFYLVRDLEDRVVNRVLSVRNESGKFEDLSDFVNRCPISIEQLSLLIRSGAFRFTEKTKQELLWQMYHLLGHTKKSEGSGSLFRLQQSSKKLPRLDDTPYEDVFDQLELFGFPLCSPFALLKNGKPSDLKAKEVQEKVGQYVEIVGYLVTVKNTRTTNARLMQFGTFVDQEGHWIDTVHFPPVAERFPFRGRGCYFLKGKVMEEFGYASIELDYMERLDYIDRDDPRVGRKATTIRRSNQKTK